jgi:hypothetical protein
LRKPNKLSARNVAGTAQCLSSRQVWWSKYRDT